MSYVRDLQNNLSYVLGRQEELLELVKECFKEIYGEKGESHFFEYVESGLDSADNSIWSLSMIRRNEEERSKQAAQWKAKHEAEKK